MSLQKLILEFDVLPCIGRVGKCIVYCVDQGECVDSIQIVVLNRRFLIVTTW